MKKLVLLAATLALPCAAQRDYGDWAEDATVYVDFWTYNSSGAPVAPSDAFEAADAVIYKADSATQKTSTNGVTMTSPFDTTTGYHLLTIDTSNDTGDAGFWATGATYRVVLSPDTETVDSQSVGATVGYFSIQARYMRGTDNASTLTTAQVNAEADTALADYDPPTNAEMVARTLVAGSYFDPITDTVANVGTVGTLTGHTAQTGDSYARLGAPAGLSLSADVAAVKSETATILADTNELQTDWANGGRLDLLLDSAATGGSVTVSDITAAALAKFITADTGETTAAAGSVAKIAQGSAGGNVTVGDITPAALAKFASTDTGETVAATGSVVKLAQGLQDGSVAVTAATLDTGGDSLAYQTSGGAGIGGALVTFYRTTEYSIDPNGAAIRAQTTTLDDGTFTDTVWLSDGVSYTVVYEATGYADHTTTVTPSS